MPRRAPAALDGWFSYVVFFGKTFTVWRRRQGSRAPAIRGGLGAARREISGWGNQGGCLGK